MTRRRWGRGLRENKTAAVPIFSPEEFTDFQDFYTKKLEGAWVMTGKRFIIPMERIENRIYLLRGHKIMLSTDLAELYGVEPRVLVQAVKRNIERFPEDFMFQLSKEEFDNLKSQIVTSSWGGLRRAAPYAFTEQGGRHVVRRSEQQKSGIGQHRDYAGFRKAPPDARL